MDLRRGDRTSLFQFTRPSQIELPKEKHPVCDAVNQLTSFIQKVSLSPEELGVWYASIANYAYWAERFKQTYTHGKIDGQGDLVVGQDNKLLYRPHKKMCLRVQHTDSALDIRSIAAAITAHCDLEISWSQDHSSVLFNDRWKKLLPSLHFTEESEKEFLSRMKKGVFNRVRVMSQISSAMKQQASEQSIYINTTPVLANGRIELLNYLREMALSVDYHRYGNLGVREGEHGNPIL
jgi:RHH-type proline utilization regulon transcriptional repressor/proline dehydrogenase/delta 1-pyrroline-5-carboxylate dehydrogenase